MKVVVDYRLCEANGMCTSVAPDVFELDDDNNLLVLDDQPPADQIGAVQDAVDSCPRRAIRTEE